jgi:thiamine kinase-like enzyme
MYIDKIDEILDNIVDSTYQTIIKEKLLTKDKYTTQSIKLIVESLINKIDKKFLEEQGLNNNTIYLDIETGYKIAEYIEGQPLSELNPLDYLQEAANVLHQVHDSQLKSEYDYDPLGRLALYEQHTKEYGHTHSDRYEELKARFLSFKDAYLNKERYTLSHGDSQISNFLKTKDELRLMDWEFAGNNDPFYDIACFGNNDFNHALALLPVYLGREATISESNRLYFYRAFQCLQWHNVALYKEFIGLSIDLGVDFMFVSNLYLDKAENFLNNIK